MVVQSPQPPLADEPDPRRIRTYHGRHGRVTERMLHVVATLGPTHGFAARPSESARPLVLEVGSGGGEAALAFGAAFPDVDLVATDVHTPGIVFLLEAVAAAGASNVFVERTDALDMLDARVASGSLAGVHVFFPDPWPKARHHKRRFIRRDVLDLLADRLAPGGQLLVATDVADYAEWAQTELDAHPAFAGGVAERPAWRPLTKYERGGMDAGRVVVDFAYRRVDSLTFSDGTQSTSGSSRP